MSKIATARNLTYLHTRVDQDNRDGLDHKYSNWICIISFYKLKIPLELQSPALIHCVLSFTEGIWTLNLISWRTVFAWDMTMIYDPTLPPSDWSKFHHMNQFDQWQDLLFNDHWLFITISSWFSEKNPVWPGPEVKAAKCETDWESYWELWNNKITDWHSMAILCDRLVRGEVDIVNNKTEFYIPEDLSWPE